MSGKQREELMYLFCSGISMNPGIKPTQESPIRPPRKHTCLCRASGTRVPSQTEGCSLAEPRLGKRQRGHCAPGPGDARRGPAVTELESWRLGEPLSPPFRHLNSTRTVFELLLSGSLNVKCATSPRRGRPEEYCCSPLTQKRTEAQGV